jgi:hypothetical protein
MRSTETDEPWGASFAAGQRPALALPAGNVPARILVVCPCESAFFRVRNFRRTESGIRELCVMRGGLSENIT